MTRFTDQTAQTPAGASEIDLLAVAAVIWRAKWWVMACAVLGILAAMVYGFRIATPMYPARATVALEAEGQQVISDIESIFAGGGTDTVAVNTEIEVFRSRVLIGRLVDDLGLIEDPEFNGFRARPSLMGRLRSLVSDWEPVVLEGAALRNHTIDEVIARITIGNVRQSLAFNISIQTNDPLKSAAIVNRLAEIYIENQIRRKLDDSTRAIEFLSERTVELQANVETLEQARAQRLEASDVIDAALLQAQNLQLRDLRARVEDAQMRAAADAALLATLRGAGDDPEALMALAEEAGDSRLSGIVQRVRTGRLGPEAAGLALADAIEGIAADLRRTQAQMETLQRSAADLTASITAQSEELIQLQQLEREVEAARLLYETFLARLQEASVQRGLETANARILSEAVPRLASSPRILILMAIAAVVGGLVGALVGLIREWRFAGFRTIDDLRQWTGRPALGSLPALATRDRRGVLQFLKDKPNSIFAEAVRNLRTSILMADPDREPQVILVTSSIPAEGKTTLAIALARYFGSLEGRRVLLVEADIRRQTLRAYVSEGQPEGVQLIDVVLGRAKLDGADLMDADLGLEVLRGSGGEFNAADLFESRRFAELIADLRTRYDHVIIDSPPVLAVPDARVLTRYADLSVFAVRWGHTTRTQVRQGLEMLHSVGRPADGLVLTQVDQRKMKGYGYSGQYGYDGYAAGYYAEE